MFRAISGISDIRWKTSKDYIRSPLPVPRQCWVILPLRSIPKDERFRMVGKKVILPAVNRVIPIIADEAIDTGFRHRCGKSYSRP